MKTLNGKIQKYNNKSGAVLAFRIVHNFWKNGIGTNKQIKNIVTIPESKLNDVLYQVLAWGKIEKALAGLKKINLLSDADAEKIKNRFARRLPRPVRPAPMASLTDAEKAKRRVFSKYGGFLD